MAIAVKGHLLLALQEQTKLLPSSVVLEAAAEKAAKIEAEQGYKAGRKQMKEIREAVLQELLPRAFTRSRRIWVWIDPVGGWLGIDGTPSDADAVLGALRDTLLEGLPVKMVRTRLSPGAVMTSWLAAGEGDAGFTIDCDCELRAVTNEKAAVRYVHHALDGRDVKDHLAAGKLPTRIALTFDDRVSFVLTEKMAIKRLAFLDVIKEEARQSTQDGDLQLEADFALMSGELARLVPALVEALGGEDEEVV